MTANGYTVYLGDDENVLKFIMLAVAQETDFSYCFWEGELDSWRTSVPIYIINIHVNMFICSMCLLDFVSYINKLFTNK